jgi:hypothetical protein
MDLRALLEPYSEDGRTVEGQIRWLHGIKGIPREYVDKAILTVYSDMEKGKTLGSGHALDAALYEMAKQEEQAALTESVNQLEAFFNNLKRPAGSRWKYLKAVFTGNLK